MNKAILSNSMVSAWAAICLLVFNQSASAAMLDETKNNYFGVFGKTAQEIKKNLQSYSEMRTNWGGFFWANSEWTTEWQFWWRESETGCSLARVEASVIVENRIPRWLNKTDATPELRARLRRTTAAIELYLRQSSSSGLKAAREIERLYTRMRTFETCDELKNAVNKRAHLTSQLYRERGRAIEQRIGYGNKQFPDLTEPVGVQTPVAGSPDKVMQGWCQLSDDLETIQHVECRFERSCEPQSSRCSINYSWSTERIQVQYNEGGPVSWNNTSAEYAFIDSSPCVRRTSDNMILCFFEQEPDQVWIYHLP
ncbi:DUF922 domain-containing protein [uncultured Roseibium sp.]|uniref:DUF922 domain-containing protein n=1 Tax=uncultured Roseibium sp. TaxID=1936171 RepID=UPI002613CABE|nr:DUF922 domain-containing protein [uncultured Roseibium sp.]